VKVVVILVVIMEGSCKLLRRFDYNLNIKIDPIFFNFFLYRLLFRGTGISRTFCLAITT
jgi:hypothetical protein